jgi:2Fe-2S ferredoxin
MPQVRFKARDGSDHPVTGEVGLSLMEVAVSNDVPGIIGECGGSMACGTCHVRVDPRYFSAVGPPGDFEAEVLDGIEPDRGSTNRLSCQIELTAELEGLVLEVAEESW